MRLHPARVQPSFLFLLIRQKEKRWWWAFQKQNMVGGRFQVPKTLTLSYPGSQWPCGPWPGPKDAQKNDTYKETTERNINSTSFCSRVTAGKTYPVSFLVVCMGTWENTCIKSSMGCETTSALKKKVTARRNTKHVTVPALMNPDSSAKHWCWCLLSCVQVEMFVTKTFEMESKTGFTLFRKSWCVCFSVLISSMSKSDLFPLGLDSLAYILLSFLCAYNGSSWYANI